MFTIDSDKIAFTIKCRYCLVCVRINPNAERYTRVIHGCCVNCRKCDTAPNIGVTTTRLIWTKLKELQINHNTGVIP